MIRVLTILIPASVLAMFLCEACLIAAAYAAGVYVNRDLVPYRYLVEDGGWRTIAAAEALILAGMYARRLYSELLVRSRIALLQELLMVLGLTFIGEALLRYFQVSWAMPRFILLPGSAIALAALYGWRIFFSAAIRNRLGLRRVLFVGLPPVAVSVIDYLNRHPETGLAPLGYLASSELDGNRIRRLGAPEDLAHAIAEYSPEYLIVEARTETPASRVDEFVTLRYSGVHIEDAASFHESTTGRLYATSLRPVELISSDAFLPNPLNVRLQLMYSAVMALVLLAPAIPLMILISAWVLLRSRRSPVIRHRCLGLGDAPFKLYRFRCPSRGLLARSCLDRLPQILNVLLGEMSIAGPAPDRNEFGDLLDRAIPFHCQRRLVRPGIFAWAELRQRKDGSGRNALRRLEYDLYYVRHLSLLLDCMIILRCLRDAVADVFLGKSR